MDSRPLPGELSARVCAGAHLSEHLVLPDRRRAMRRPCACGSARSRRRDRGSATCASGSCCGVKAGRTTRSGSTGCTASRACRCGMRARRKKRLSLHRGVVPPASGRNQDWSMDFVHDQLVTGRAFRVLTVIDQWSRESVLLEANVALTGQSVVDALEAVVRPSPAAEGDHGRSRHRVHVQGARRMGLSTRRRAWTSSGPASPSRTRLSRVSTAACVTSA